MENFYEKDDSWTIPTFRTPCNGRRLYVRLRKWKMVHDFGSASDCDEAIERLNRGQNFCDYTNGNKLYNSRFRMLRDFGSTNDCRRTIEFRPRLDRVLCDYSNGNLLLDENFRVLHNFDSSADCDRALSDYEYGARYFCEYNNGNLLLDNNMN